jgi:hypothetical protein
MKGLSNNNNLWQTVNNNLWQTVNVPFVAFSNKGYSVVMLYIAGHGLWLVENMIMLLTNRRLVWQMAFGTSKRTSWKLYAFEMHFQLISNNDFVL